MLLHHVVYTSYIPRTDELKEGVICSLAAPSGRVVDCTVLSERRPDNPILLSAIDVIVLYTAWVIHNASILY